MKKKGALVRLNSFLTKDQKKDLIELAKGWQTSEGEIVRAAVESFTKRNLKK